MTDTSPDSPRPRADDEEKRAGRNPAAPPAARMGDRLVSPLAPVQRIAAVPRPPRNRPDRPDYQRASRPDGPGRASRPPSPKQATAHGRLAIPLYSTARRSTRATAPALCRLSQDRRRRMPGPPDPAAAIREQFPGWTIWVSDTGRWWAFEKTELTAADVAAGCVPFLHTDESDTLARQIRAQQARRRHQAAGG